MFLQGCVMHVWYISSTDPQPGRCPFQSSARLSSFTLWLLPRLPPPRLQIRSQLILLWLQIPPMSLVTPALLWALRTLRHQKQKGERILSNLHSHTTTFKVGYYYKEHNESRVVLCWMIYAICEPGGITSICPFLQCWSIWFVVHCLWVLGRSVGLTCTMNHSLTGYYIWDTTSLCDSLVSNNLTGRNWVHLLRMK